MTDGDEEVYADAPRVFQTARDMIEALDRGAGQEAMNLVANVDPAQRDFLAWTLAEALVKITRDADGLRIDDVLRQFDKTITRAISDDVNRGLRGLDDDDGPE